MGSKRQHLKFFVAVVWAWVLVGEVPAKLAMWVGGSVKIQNQHYLERVSEEETEAYFSLKPEEDE